jgi:fermentation-respiration switch protein FrsA (DUF1100 family)
MLTGLSSFLKYYEKKGIYFPVKNIDLTPKEIGLEFEDIYFFSSDGTELNGWFVPAKGSRLTVLFCHGNAGNISHRIELIEMFYQLGLNVFIFDYRGYGRSHGSPSEGGLYLDAHAAYKYLIDNQHLDEGSIVVYGKSLGANVAIELCSKVKYDALSKIENITVPKLIIHSEDDEIIPFQHGRRLFEAAPEPKEFYPMRGGHNEAIFLSKKDFAARIGKFLRESCQ